MDDADDINRLIAEINARPGAEREPDEAAEAEPDEPAADADAGAAFPADSRLDGWLTQLVARKGSDLLLVADAPPAVRRDADLQFLEGEKLSGPEIERAVLPALSASSRRAYRERWNADASLRRGGRRFRVNLHRERGRAAAAIRALPAEPPSFAALGLPDEVARLAHLARGLVLVTGPTGSGKTTTLAALVAEINRSTARHVVTIEDPIEYEHAHRRAVIEQVEIGVDAPDFASALRAALRQAPDVIVIGEMRDSETMAIALAAAETGHLVLSTLHSSDTAGAVARLADSFPPERQATVRQEIAMAIAAIVSQHLLPRADGKGRALAIELLLATDGARQHIRKNALHHLHQEIAIARKLGAVSLEQSLAKLAKAGIVSAEDARSRAPHPEEFDSFLRG
ncbi:MAG TPA: PilT/PilU family type 4a pilus ATPase [Thermoanaerobaculia bacterium]|nr:PilT/PilU family type 4a pilus ATPase [Thermoanaerobaculia bacterium]